MRLEHPSGVLDQDIANMRDLCLGLGANTGPVAISCKAEEEEWQQDGNDQKLRKGFLDERRGARTLRSLTIIRGLFRGICWFDPLQHAIKFLRSSPARPPGFSVSRALRERADQPNCSCAPEFPFILSGFD